MNKFSQTFWPLICLVPLLSAGRASRPPPFWLVRLPICSSHSTVLASSQLIFSIQYLVSTGLFFLFLQLWGPSPKTDDQGAHHLEGGHWTKHIQRTTHNARPDLQHRFGRDNGWGEGGGGRKQRRGKEGNKKRNGEANDGSLQGTEVKIKQLQTGTNNI